MSGFFLIRNDFHAPSNNPSNFHNPSDNKQTHTRERTSIWYQQAHNNSMHDTNQTSSSSVMKNCSSERKEAYFFFYQLNYHLIVFIIKITSLGGVCSCKNNLPKCSLPSIHHASCELGKSCMSDPGHHRIPGFSQGKSIHYFSVKIHLTCMIFFYLVVLGLRNFS